LTGESVPTLGVYGSSYKGKDNKSRIPAGLDMTNPFPKSSTSILASPRFSILRMAVFFVRKLQDISEHGGYGNAMAYKQCVRILGDDFLQQCTGTFLNVLVTFSSGYGNSIRICPPFCHKIWLFLHKFRNLSSFPLAAVCFNNSFRKKTEVGMVLK